MDTKVAVVNRIHEVRRPFEFAPFLHVVISALFRLSVRICERAKDNPEALNLLNNLLFNEKGAAATSRAIWRQTTHSDLHTTFTMMLPDPPSDFNSHESVHRLALFQTYSVSFPESKEHHLFFSDDLSITRSIEATNLLRNLNSSRSPSFPDLLNCLVIHMILGAITFKDRILASFANADNVTELMTICDEIEPMFHQCFLDEYRNYFMGHTGIDQWAKSSD